MSLFCEIASFNGAISETRPGSHLRVETRSKNKPTTTNGLLDCMCVSYGTDVNVQASLGGESWLSKQNKLTF